MRDELTTGYYPESSVGGDHRDPAEDLGRGAAERSDDDNEALDSGRAADDDGHVPKIKVAIDWVEFEGALENNSPDLKSFLNLLTGDVIRVVEGESAELTMEEAESSDEYLLIDPISSREQYRWMEEFIEVIDDATLKDKLNIAIDGKGAFRRFKDVLMGYPTERERWFSKRSGKLHAHMAAWLTEKRVVSTNTPPWEASPESGHRRQEDRRAKGDGEPRSWREGAADLRAVAHDLVDIVPSRELPTAVAFLEFLKGRRSHRRSNNS